MGINRKALIVKLREQQGLSKEDSDLLMMLENELYPDFSIDRYLEIKADYKMSLVRRGLL